MKIIYPWIIIFFLVLIFLPNAVFSNGLPPKEKLCPNGDCRGHINITGDFKNKKLINIRAITKSDQEKPLITFNFEQENEKMMLLQVVNNSKYDIKYHLVMMPLKEEKFFRTSSCPVLAGKMVFESWPFPIYQLLVPEIFIVEETDKKKCEY